MCRKYKLEDLLGRKFNYLTMIGEDYILNNNNKNRLHYKFQCVCGKIVYRSLSAVLAGTAKSCGCKHPMRTVVGRDHKGWKGVGNLSGQYFHRIKSRAKDRNIPFNITIDDMWVIFLEQRGNCALTGLLLQITRSRNKIYTYKQTASLDRKDSTKGYTIDNIQWVHKDINMMKQHYNQDYFIKMCKLVTITVPA